MKFVHPTKAELEASDALVVTQAEIETAVDLAFENAVPGTPTADSINERLKALDDAFTAARAGYLDALQYSRGMALYALVTTYTDTTHFAAATLAGFGDGAFNNYMVYVLRDAGGAAAAPQDEWQPVTTYTSTGGVIAHAVFTAPLAVGDTIMLVHKNLYNILLISDRLSAARAGYLDELDFDLDARLGTPATSLAADLWASGAYREVVKEIWVSSAANAGDLVLATVTGQAILIESIFIYAGGVTTADLTSCGIFAGTAKALTLIPAANAVQAKLDAESKQVGAIAPVRLKVADEIVMSLLGTGATAVDLTVTIKYRACVSGGYI